MTSARELPPLGPLRLPEVSPAPALLRRIGLAAALIVFVAIVLGWDRDGLRDNLRRLRDREHVSFTRLAAGPLAEGDAVVCLADESTGVHRAPHG